MEEVSSSLEPTIFALRRRGFKVKWFNETSGLILPDPPTVENMKNYLRLLNHYYFRRTLALVLERGGSALSSDRILSLPSYDSNVKRLEALSLLKEENYSKPFGKTLEWFVAQLLKEEFGLPAVWGVKMGVAKGGDFDVISLLEGRIFYVECKASPPQNVHVDEMRRFLKRLEVLKPDISLFFLDTTLKIERNVISNLRYLLGLTAEPVLLKDGVYRLHKGFYAASSRRSISGNLGVVIKDTLST